MDDPKLNEALVSMGLNMMARSGPSKTGGGFGQIMGQSGLAGMQTYQQAQQREMQQAQRQQQMEMQQQTAQRQQSALDLQIAKTQQQPKLGQNYINILKEQGVGSRDATPEQIAAAGQIIESRAINRNLASFGGREAAKREARLDEPIFNPNVLSKITIGGKPAQFGVTPRQLIEQADLITIPGKVEGATAQEQGLNLVNQLESMLGGLNSAKGWMARLTQAPGRTIDLYLQRNPSVVAYNDFSQATVAPLLRTIGEKGNMSNRDIERAIKAIPRVAPVPDTNEVSKRKIKALKEFISRASGGTIEMPTTTPKNIPKGAPEGAQVAPDGKIYVKQGNEYYEWTP